MIIKKIPAGVYAANCYVIIDEVTKETAVIDPGGDSDEIIKYIDSMNCNVKYILLTHAHADHTGAVDDIRGVYKVPVCVNIKDEKMMQESSFMFGKYEKNDDLDIYVNEGDIIKLGKIEIKCLETPGHTPGGMCYLIENKIISGDTLFAGSIGRTDLQGGDYDTIINSIREKIMVLGDEIEVLPGHGSKSTVGTERMYNPFL